MKRGREAPFTAYSCQDTVFVLMADQIPPGSLLDVLRNTGVGKDRGADGESIAIDRQLSLDIAKPLFDLLAGRAIIRIDVDMTDETFGTRMLDAADYLQLPPSISNPFHAITTAFLPWDTILHFPHISRQKWADAPDRLRYPCRVQRIRHKQEVNLCLVSFIGEETFDCAYRISFLPDADAFSDDIEIAFLRSLARDAEPSNHTSRFYLVHACANNRKCRHIPASSKFRLDVESRDILTFLEVCYDIFHRFPPSIRVFGKPTIFGEVVQLPEWYYPY